MTGVVVLLLPSRGLAQERPPIFINEVLADNGPEDRDNDGQDEFFGVAPIDIGGRTADMIEIYNASKEPFPLGRATDEQSFYLSDGLVFCAPEDQSCAPEDRAWRFPVGMATIPPEDSIIVFCDNNQVEGQCELHATFDIGSDGREPITLWGPLDPITGERPVVDQVWLPPLRRNISFGRFPDGAGPAPVPVDETFDHFVFNQQGSVSPPTFGSCIITGPACILAEKRFCSGGPTLPGANISPRVRRVSHSTNSPAAREAVEFTVRVRDDKEPTPENPENIAHVEIRYRVDNGDGFGPVEIVEMDYDVITGVLPDLFDWEPCMPGDPDDPDCIRPLNRRTLWNGAIPGQAAGARVEYLFHVEDQEGAFSTSPRPLCEDGTGPCDRQFGGFHGGEFEASGCQRDLADITCRGGGGDDEEDDDDGADEAGDGGGAGGAPVIGERYIACEAWFSYAVGYEPRGDLASVVINEVVAIQQSLLLDPTHLPCAIADGCPDSAPDCCRAEDFIELYNGSDVEVSLAGLWLSNSFFRPRGWQFPSGSKIGPGEYLIVWIDADGAKCPDEFRSDPPCFWECPDPTDPDLQRYHTNFNIGFSGDQIFLFDNEENDFGLIHGLDFEFRVEDVDKSMSLFPDGNARGCFFLTANPTPGLPNTPDAELPSCPLFKRGDATSDCGVDLSDAVRILNWLFLGFAAPTCIDAADADDNGQIELTDAIRILNWLFTGGAEPANPGPRTAGTDPTEDGLAECVYPENCL